jgi:hypothetical protein
MTPTSTATHSDLADRPTDELLELLLVASAMWARRRPVDLDGVAQLRHLLLRRRHARYVAHVPVYAHLARSIGAPEDDRIDVATITSELLLDAAIFKSYDPAWPTEGRFDRLTAWLTTISTVRPQLETGDLTDVAGWIHRLRDAGTSVARSSGTSGPVSFVPRDEATLRALARNGRFYAHSTWPDDGDGGFDCLVLGPAASDIGVLSAARGLAHAATRTHHLVRAGRSETTGAAAWAAPPVPDDGDYAAAREFLADAVGSQRPVLVFGVPAALARLCHWLETRSRPVALPPGSRAVTGGGWKADTPLAPEDLAELVQGSLGLPPASLSDGYSSTESNVVLAMCPNRRYHVPPVVDALVLDALLRPIDGDDVTGTLALLDPFAGSYPGFLITGDRARLVRHPCPCGLAGPALLEPIRRGPGFDARGCSGAMSSTRV